MIACAARTGSTMLVHLLRAHPDITCHGELFGERITGLSGAAWRRRLAANPEAMNELELIREASPLLFLYKFALDPMERTVAGFKLKYDELVRDDYSEIRDLVVSDTDLKIVFLHRANLFHRFVSFYVANAITHTTLLRQEDESPEIRPFELAPETCARDFAETERRTELFRDLFAHHRSIDCSYESLIAEPENELGKIFDFLGVQQRPVGTPTKKIIERPMREIVSNYDAIASYFSGGPYASFFDE